MWTHNALMGTERTQEASGWDPFYCWVSKYWLLLTRRERALCHQNWSILCGGCRPEAELQNWPSGGGGGVHPLVDWSTLSWVDVTTRERPVTPKDWFPVSGFPGSLSCNLESQLQAG